MTTDPTPDLELPPAPAKVDAMKMSPEEYKAAKAALIKAATTKPAPAPLSAEQLAERHAAVRAMTRAEFNAAKVEAARAWER